MLKAGKGKELPRILDAENDKLYESIKKSRIADHHAWQHPTKGWRRKSKVGLAVAAMTAADRGRVLEETLRKFQVQ